MIMKKIVALFIAATAMLTLMTPHVFAVPSVPLTGITGYVIEKVGAPGEAITRITKGMSFNITINTDVTVVSGSTATATIGSCQFTQSASAVSTTTTGSYSFNFANVTYNGGSTTLQVKVNVNDSAGVVTTYVIGTSIIEAVDVPEVSTTPTTPAPVGKPSFELYSNGSFVIKAGETSNISLYVQNISTAMAKGLTATISATEGGITFPSGNVYRSSYDIEEWERRGISFSVSVPATTPAGSYPLDVKISTTDKDGAVSESIIKIFLDVTSNIRLAALDVVEYSVDKTLIKSGDAFTVTVKLKNNCGVDLTDVKLGFDGLDGSKFAMNSGLASTTIKIKKDAEFTMKVGLVGCAGINSIREVLTFLATYRIIPSDVKTEQIIKTPVTITCEKPPEKPAEGDVLAPGIIITKYDFGAEYVVGGVVFPLSLSFQNASGVSAIQNLKVVIEGVPGTGTDTGIAFSPANSSNSFFFPSLAAGASTAINLDMLPRADSKPNSYPLQVTFNYEYLANGKSKKADAITEKIVIPLQQEDRFVANPMELGQQSAFMGQEFSINSTFVNKGKSAVYNVTVDVAGSGFDKTSTAYYIGNVESGKEEYYDTRIIPTAEGELKGEVVVSYEDANGKQKELRVPFMTTVMATQGGGMGGGDMNGSISIDGGMAIGPDGKPVGGDVKAGLPLWAKIAIPAGAVVILGAGAVVFLKIMKKKKLKKIEKEDSDEDI